MPIRYFLQNSLTVIAPSSQSSASLFIANLILDAAARVVRARGLAHATTKEIARAAGLSEAALYKYFRDKEDLFVVLMQERLPQWIGVLTDLLARAGTGNVAGNLETVAYEAVLFYADFVPMAASLFAEPDILEKHRKRLHRDNLGPHHANGAVAEYVRKEQRKGRIPRSVDPEAAAALVLGGAFQRAFLRRAISDSQSSLRPSASSRSGSFRHSFANEPLSGSNRPGVHTSFAARSFGSHVSSATVAPFTNARAQSMGICGARSPSYVTRSW